MTTKKKTTKKVTARPAPASAGTKRAKVSPSTTKSKGTGRSDLQTLCEFLKSIDGANFMALQPSRARLTQSAAHEDATEAAHERGLRKYSYVTWHRQSHDDAFDKKGNLVDKLYLHWGGDHKKVADKLRRVPKPYVVEAGDDTSAFVIRKPVGGSSQLSDEAAVMRRLKSLDNDYSEATEQWLHEVIRRGPTSCVLRALSQVLSYVGFATRSAELAAEYGRAAVHDDEVDLVTKNWESLVLAAKDPHYGLQTVFELFRRVRTSIQREQDRAAILDRSLAHAHRQLRLAALSELENDVSSITAERLRESLKDADSGVAHRALTCLVPVEAALHERTECDVALELAEDSELTAEQREASIVVAARSLQLEVAVFGNEIHAGALAIAQDERYSMSLRVRAFDVAVDYLKNCTDAESRALAKRIRSTFGTKISSATKTALDGWH
jgi:hypothetical protein